MSKFYTSVFSRGNYIYSRGYNDGRTFKEKIEFNPTVFVSGKPKGCDEEPWHTIYGDTVYPLYPGSIRETKDLKKKYEDVHGFDIYGSTGFNYEYIANTWTKEVPYDINLINTTFIDIETDVTHGRFPKPELADEEIVLITIWSTNRSLFHTFSFRPIEPIKDAELHIATDEKRMLMDFITFWSENYPDTITDWNGVGFDIPYLVNRITNVLGEDFANKLSPWGWIYAKESKDDYGNIMTIYDLAGINHLDYMLLYKKFILKKQESYKLDHIGEVEIGEKKKEYTGSFKNFLDTRWQDFVEYNIQDVRLIIRLNDKLRLLELAYSISYYAKVNPNDVYSPVKLWDNIIYSYLLERRKVIPNMVFKNKSEKFDGAFVLDPVIGLQRFVCSFDLTSLYPHIMMGSNISPETIQPGNYPHADVDNLLAGTTNTDSAKEMNVSITASSNMYTNEFRGMFPDLMETMFNRRKAAKKEMLKAEQEEEYIKKELEKRGISV